MSSDELSLASIEAGSIPIAAQKRLDALRKRGDTFFTSDLSVNEFLLARQQNFVPITQVMGSSVYVVGHQGSRASRGKIAWQRWPELPKPTDAWNDARGRALGRLAEEARRANGHYVAGVRLKCEALSGSSKAVEIAAYGTAMRSTYWDIDNAPILTNLSGQDFAKLFTSGWWPVGLLTATTVVSMGLSMRSARARRGLVQRWSNSELPDYTTHLNQARGRAVDRLKEQADRAGADGIVGLQFDYHIEKEKHDSIHLILTLHAVGTGIAEVRKARFPPTDIALALEDNA
jgi:uncharacterized protein YbjQ (UPF0145 family)